MTEQYEVEKAKSMSDVRRWRLYYCAINHQAVSNIASSDLWRGVVKWLAEPSKAL